MGRIRTVMVAAAAALLAAALVPVAMREAQAASWRVPADQRPYVERALGEATAIFNMSPAAYRRLASPSVERRCGRTGVALASHDRGGGGSYFACYDDRSRRKLSERAVGCSFGATPLADRLRAFLLNLGAADRG
jgi:hypothetical protein